MKKTSFGVPYKGSKNRIAESLIGRLPSASNFVDLFCGGCAITHAALLSGKWKNIYANDLDGRGLRLFLGAANGKYKDDTRWISCEDFLRLKETSPCIAVCWSFGNNLRDYLYSKEIEPWKRALHWARVYNDLSAFRAMGVNTDGTRTDIIAHKDEYKAAYIGWYLAQRGERMPSQDVMTRIKELIKLTSDELRQYLRDALKESGLSQKEVERRLGNVMASHYFGYLQWQFPTEENYNKMREWMPLKPYAEVYALQKQNYILENFQSLENFQRLNRINSLMEFRDRINTIKPSYKDYREVRIPENSVVYCDIPYCNTNVYSSNFNHNEFYEWAKRQTELVVISEYHMPEGFCEVFRRQHISSLSSTSKHHVTEKLFVPEHQVEEYYRRLEPVSLFNYEKTEL